MEQGYQLRAKQRPQLLLAMMKTLARTDARISFEGNLSHTELVKLSEASFDETQVLRRNTTSPKMDFLVSPLTPEMVSVIEKAVVSKVAFNGYAGIIHVQIESGGRLAFSACDNFQDGCVWVSPAVAAALLTETRGKEGSSFLRPRMICCKIAITLIVHPDNFVPSRNRVGNPTFPA